MQKEYPRHMHRSGSWCHCYTAKWYLKAWWCDYPLEQGCQTHGPQYGTILCRACIWLTSYWLSSALFSRTAATAHWSSPFPNSLSGCFPFPQLPPRFLLSPHRQIAVFAQESWPSPLIHSHSLHLHMGQRESQLSLPPPSPAHSYTQTQTFQVYVFMCTACTFLQWVGDRWVSG